MRNLLKPWQHFPHEQLHSIGSRIVGESEHEVTETQVRVGLDLIRKLIRRSNHRLILRKEAGLHYGLCLLMGRRQGYAVADVRLDDGVVVTTDGLAVLTQGVEPALAEVEVGIVNIGPVGILGNNLQRSLRAKAADQNGGNRIRTRRTIGIIY